MGNQVENLYGENGNRAGHIAGELETLFENMVCAVMEYRLHRDGHLTMLQANREAIRIFGYTEEEFWAKKEWNFSDFAAEPQDRKTVLSEKDRIIQCGGSSNFEYRQARRDGSYCWVRGTSVVMGKEGDDVILLTTLMDVTSWKQSTEENRQFVTQIKAENRLLNMALDKSFVREFYYYPKKKQIFNPESTCEMFHIQPYYENAPESFHAEVLPEYLETYRNMYWKLWNGSDKSSGSFQLKNGVWVHCLLSTVEKDENGAPEVVVGLVEDITKQKKKDETYGEMAAAYNHVINCIGENLIGIYRMDLNTGQTESIKVPENVREIFRWYDNIDQITEKVEQYYHPADRKKFKRLFTVSYLREQREKGRKRIHAEFQRLVDDRYRWTAVSVYINDGIYEDNKAVILLEDIEDVRRKLQIISSLSSDYYAVYTVDLKKDTVAVVRSDKDVAVKLRAGKGLQFTKMIELYIEQFIHPDDQEMTREFVSLDHIKEITEKHTTAESIYFRKRVDEDYLWMQARFIGVEGAGLTAVGIRNVDDTIKKDLETKALLRDALTRAESANALKTDFLSKMSHDIRTPMNAIIGMTALAGTYLTNQEKVKDCLKKINVSSKLLLSMINEVLDMSKIESGNLNLEYSEFGLADFLQDILTIMQPLMEKKKQEFHIHVEDVRHEAVIGDLARMGQIFTNILSNAMKYTPEGGRIDLEIRELSSNATAATYEFVFRDNGIGMTDEFQSYVFDPFSREYDSRISSIQGTGLGMAITYNLVKMMDGEIRLESKVGEGSVFTVTLHLRLQKDDKENVEALADLPVLIVDDDEVTCMSICNILSSIGMKGDWVTDGESAVRKTIEAHEKNQDYFAVVLDWMMPGMNGIETAKKIRRNLGETVPIVVLTAYDWSEVEEEAREAGINEFLSKPLFRTKLLYLFENLVEGKEEGASAECREIRYLDGIRLLLVEDNPLNTEVASELLKLQGAQVETAQNGKVGFEKFFSNGPGYYHAILMDIQMPVMNGYEAARAIRNSGHPDSHTIPIIAMTANAFADDVKRTMSAGMNAHIAKPIDLEEMRKVICRLTLPGEEEL